MLLSGAVSLSSAELRTRIGHKVWNASVLPQVRGLWPRLGQDCKSVRISAFEQCPRRDSNLRSRLRKALHHLALTSGNVPTGDPSGHVLGTGQITAEAVITGTAVARFADRRKAAPPPRLAVLSLDPHDAKPVR